MVIADMLLFSCLMSAASAASFGSFLLGGVSGVLLALTVISAHNFFHQRDNVRMYYFDLSLMPSRLVTASEGNIVGNDEEVKGSEPPPPNIYGDINEGRNVRN
jgi:hypothetical protein